MALIILTEKNFFATLQFSRFAPAYRHTPAWLRVLEEPPAATTRAASSATKTPAPRPKASEGAGIAMRRYSDQQEGDRAEGHDREALGQLQPERHGGQRLEDTTAVATTVSNQARTAEK